MDDESCINTASNIADEPLRGVVRDTVGRRFEVDVLSVVQGQRWNLGERATRDVACVMMFRSAHRWRALAQWDIPNCASKHGLFPLHSA